MVEKLKVKAIYNDFVSNVSLTEEQKKILDMLIKKETIVKISMEIGMSQRTVGYEIKKIKQLYNDYYNLQLYKAILLSQ
jgi:transcriptional antiterminator